MPRADPNPGLRASVALGRHFLLVLYDHLGGAVVVNLIWVCLSLPWLAAGFGCLGLGSAAAAALGRPSLLLVGLGSGATLIAWSPVTLLVVAATAPWGRGRDASLGVAWALARRQALRAQAVGAGLTGVVAILLANALFYQAWGGWPGRVLGAFMLWLVAATALVSLYAYPLMVAWPERRLPELLRHSVGLVLDNLRFSVALLAAAVGLAAVCVASGAGLVLGGVPALVLMLNLGLARVLERYGAEPVERDPRGWRDLLRPWEGPPG